MDIRAAGSRDVAKTVALTLERRLVDVVCALLRDGREYTLDKPALTAAT